VNQQNNQTGVVVKDGSILRSKKSRFESTFPRSTAALVKVKDAWRDLRSRGRTAEAVFTDIYERNLWGDSESLSGRGSTLARTTVIRRALPQLLAEVGASVMLDAPCGDFNWMQHAELGPVRYIGADVVPRLISRNSEKYSVDGREFITLDITVDSIPTVDVILCRDCFIHFSFRDIRAALRNFKKSNSAYLFVTTHVGVRDHRNIVSGQGRNVNLQLPPFNFPTPLKLVVEDPDLNKCLGVWRLEQIQVE